MQDNLQKEVNHLARVLKQNGYLVNFIRNASAPAHTGNSRYKQPKMKDRRRRRDHWWWYPTCMWLG